LENGNQSIFNIITHDKVNNFDGHPLARRPILMAGNARPYNPYSARLSATGGNRDTTLVSHVTGYESDKAFMGLSRTKSEQQ
jgi:hypothetical protein